MASRSDHTFDLGEHWVIQITCHDDPAGAAAMNLTNGDVAFAMKRGGALGVMTLNVASGNVSLTDPLNGVATITVKPSDQTGLAPGAYNYTIRATPASGTVSDQAYGMITVRGTEFPAP